MGAFGSVTRRLQLEVEWVSRAAGFTLLDLNLDISGLREGDFLADFVVVPGPTHSTTKSLSLLSRRQKQHAELVTVSSL